MQDQGLPPMGVVIVTYGSDDVIGACLASLAASNHGDLRVVVSDNGSPDSTCEVVRDFARTNGIALTEVTPAAFLDKSHLDAPGLTLITTGENRGFAGGVNMGLEYLLRDPAVDQFWILNPDCEARPDTASAYGRAAVANPGFGMLGGRTLYHGENGMIQSDGGRVNLWTGVCSNINFARQAAETPMPGADELDYLSGANFVVSRGFIDRVGLMHEDYFLYYEEVDWALRRGDLPIILSDEAVVLHHAGTSIGSGTKTRPHTPFSNYFNFRSRMIFMRRFRPWAVPVSYLFSSAKIVQFLIKAGRAEAWGAWKGLNGLAPPGAVLARLDDSARAHLSASPAPHRPRNPAPRATPQR